MFIVRVIIKCYAEDVSMQCCGRLF